MEKVAFEHDLKNECEKKEVERSLQVRPRSLGSGTKCGNIDRLGVKAATDWRSFYWVKGKRRSLSSVL